MASAQLGAAAKNSDVANGAQPVAISGDLAANRKPVVEHLAPEHRVLEHITIGDVPVLISRPAVVRADAKLVVLFHGFGPPENPERLAEAIPLDGTNLIGVYVNLPMIAARLPAGGVDELRRVQMDDFVNGLYFRSISGASRELPAVVRFVASKYGVDTSRGIGLFGFSAGGCAALLAVTETDLPVAAVVAVNAPQSVRQNVASWEHDLKRTFVWDKASEAAAARFDVSAHARDIARRTPRPAILFIQGDRDEHLALEPVEQASSALRNLYGVAGDASKIELRIVPGLSHNFGPVAHQGAQPVSDGTPILRATLAWFESQLLEPTRGSHS
jgi:pimeloyl-ACP methyl ester carboxylesterase